MKSPRKVIIKYFIFLILLAFTSNNTIYGQLGLTLSAIKAVKSAKKSKDYQDQGITSDIHEIYVGKIVWSDEEIALKDPDEAKFKDSFSLMDNIHGRVYLKKSMQNTIHKNTKDGVTYVDYSYNVYIDGVQIKDYIIDNGMIREKGLEITTHKVCINGPDISYVKKDSWSCVINPLAPGDYTIKVDLISSQFPDKVFASGQFLLKKKEGDVFKLGKSYSSFEAGMQDAEIEEAGLLCMQKLSKQPDWTETYNKVIIKSDEWNIIRNSLSGAIIGRTLELYCFATSPDGRCSCQEFDLIQSYNGSDYSSVFKWYATGGQVTIDCE